MGRIRARAVGGELTLLVHRRERSWMIRAAERTNPAVLTHLMEDTKSYFFSIPDKSANEDDMGLIHVFRRRRKFFLVCRC